MPHIIRTNDLSAFSRGFFQAMGVDVSELSPERVRDLVSDCERYSKHHGIDQWSDVGAHFYAQRQAGELPSYPPI